jgi:Ca2+-binding RTX toxin-like protein
VRIIGDLNDDTIVGSDVTDQIGGLNGSDTIDGGGNADILAGGLGQDFLTGGAGADFFTFEAVNDSATGASRDRILDFDQGSDTVTLSAIDAIAGGAGDMFVFIGELGFNVGEAGRLRYFHNGQGNTIVQGEVNGDGIADFSIQINGMVNLASADFEL